VRRSGETAGWGGAAEGTRRCGRDLGAGGLTIV
jgi:hypothetical protein